MSPRGIKTGTLLGKCTWCTQPIREGEGIFSSLWAKIIQTKWYCAECLAELKPVVDELALEKEYYEDRKRVCEETGDVDFIKQKWIVDTNTGKIRINPKFNIASKHTKQ